MSLDGHSIFFAQGVLLVSSLSFIPRFCSFASRSFCSPSRSISQSVPTEVSPNIGNVHTTTLFTHFIKSHSEKVTPTTRLACVAWRFCRAGRRSGVAARKIKTANPYSWPFHLPPPSTHFDILLTTCLVSVFPANQK